MEEQSCPNSTIYTSGFPVIWLLCHTLIRYVIRGHYIAVKILHLSKYVHDYCN